MMKKMIKSTVGALLLLGLLQPALGSNAEIKCMSGVDCKNPEGSVFRYGNAKRAKDIYKWEHLNLGWRCCACKEKARCWDMPAAGTGGSVNHTNQFNAFKNRMNGSSSGGRRRSNTKSYVTLPMSSSVSAKPQRAQRSVGNTRSGSATHRNRSSEHQRKMEAKRARKRRKEAAANAANTLRSTTCNPSAGTSSTTCESSSASQKNKKETDEPVPVYYWPGTNIRCGKFTRLTEGKPKHRCTFGWDGKAVNIVLDDNSSYIVCGMTYKGPFSKTVCGECRGNLPLCKPCGGTGKVKGLTLKAPKTHFCIDCAKAKGMRPTTCHDCGGTPTKIHDNATRRKYNNAVKCAACVEKTHPFVKRHYVNIA